MRVKRTDLNKILEKTAISNNKISNYMRKDNTDSGFEKLKK